MSETNKSRKRLPKGIPLTTARKKTKYGRRLLMMQKHLPLDICWVIDKLAGQTPTGYTCAKCGFIAERKEFRNGVCPIPDYTHVGLFWNRLREGWVCGWCKTVALSSVPCTRASYTHRT